MLLQSHAGEIHVLPALPATWQKGYIHGLSARGGFDVDIDWDNGKLTKLTVLSKLGNPGIVRFGGKTVRIATVKGGKYSFDGNLDPL